MKKLAYNLLRPLGLLLLMGLSMNLLANAPQRQEFTKTLNKQYTVASGSLVELNNKYGKINVHTWGGDKVKITVVIKVQAKSESDAQAVFDRIGISFYNTPGRVGASTEINTPKSSWWSWGGSGDDFAIYYDVHMPANGSVDIDAKYCDVYCAALEGSGDLAVKYGNFKLDGFDRDAKLSLGYGNGVLSRANDVHLNLSYGNMEIGNANNVVLEMSYSNLGIDRGNDITTNSRYSSLKLGTVQEFRNEGSYDNIEIMSAREAHCITRYTNVDVRALSDNITLDMQYGSAKLRNIASGATELVLNGRYTDFKIYMPRTQGCAVEVAGRYTDIDLPSNRLNANYNVQNGSSHEIRGTLGTGGKPLIKARLDYGGFMVVSE